MLETQLVEEGVTPQITHENNSNLILALLILFVALQGILTTFFQLGNSLSLGMALFECLTT